MATNKILFLTANPLSQDPNDRLALDHEARDIEQRLYAVKHRDLFEFKTKWAVRPGDLHEALLREEPTIVHFSGHGSGTQGIVLQGTNENEIKLVNSSALKHLFAVLKENIRIVVLNACYSEEQATAIVETIDFVVGMKDSIEDRAARTFATAFYQGLGFGKSIQTSFDIGVSALKLEHMIDDEDIPVLLTRTGADAKHTTLVGPKQHQPQTLEPQWLNPGTETNPFKNLTVHATHSLPFNHTTQAQHTAAPHFTPPISNNPQQLPRTNQGSHTAISDKSIRGIFRVEVENKGLDSNEFNKATSGLFSSITPQSGVSNECILLLRTMRCIAHLQHLAHPKAKDLDWTYTSRLLEATESVLVENGYDIERLGELAKDALQVARFKRLLIFKDEDEWRPGMASGSGWVEYACLSNIGERLLDKAAT